MAQSGYTPILIYASGTTTNVPLAANLTSSSAGAELALNYADGKLFYKDSGGVVQVLASKAGNVNVASFSAGTTGFTPSTATSGAVTLAGTLATTNGGTGLTSFTANGVVYASSTSALATGTALTFDGTNFATTGTATATKLIPTGSSVTGNGLYLPAANALGLSTNGTNAVYIDSSQNVGIGTSSPSYKLDILTGTGGVYAAQFGNGTAAQGMRIATGADSAGSMLTDAGGTRLVLFDRTNNNTLFYTNATERMRIDSSGNVGIGTTTPGTTPGAGQLVVAGANVAFATNDNANLVVRSTDAAATNKGGMLGFAGASDSGNITFATIKGAKEGADSGYLAFATRTAAAYATERMRIDSTGIVSIGVNTNYFGERLSIYQSSTTAPVTFAYAQSGSFTGSAHIIQSEAASGTTWKMIDGRSQTGTIRFNVFGNGTVQNSTGTYTTISDAKLKENVVDANPQLNKLMQTRVVNYNLIGDDLKQIGWVAQDLEQIFPSMVFESPDKTPEGEDLGTTTKGVKLTVFIPILVKAIQEQQALITALTERITALENK